MVVGNSDGITAGLKVGWTTKNGNDMSVRLEFYQQRGSLPAGKQLGNQVGLVRYPDLGAIIFQFSYQFGH